MPGPPKLPDQARALPYQVSPGAISSYLGSSTACRNYQIVVHCSQAQGGSHASLAMRWPWSSNPCKESEEKPPTKWIDILTSADWSHYRDPRNLIPVVFLTTTALSLAAFYRSYLRRIPQAGNIQPGFWRRRSLFGKVTSVGDADNFRLFHTPGGRLAGWGWLPGRKVPGNSKELRDNTVRTHWLNASNSSFLIVDLVGTCSFGRRGCARACTFR